MGRNIQITAGFRYIAPVMSEVSKISNEGGRTSMSRTPTTQSTIPTSDSAPQAAGGGTGLFDAIEDVEENLWRRHCE